MKPQIDVRPLRPDEREAWEPLWSAYLAFYETAVTADVTETTWRRLHDPAEPMHVLGAFIDGRLVGIVHYLFHRTTWTIGDYCYLQDLFTSPEARGRAPAAPSSRRCANRPGRQARAACTG